LIGVVLMLVILVFGRGDLVSASVVILRTILVSGALRKAWATRLPCYLASSNPGGGARNVSLIAPKPMYL
jgi:hypothetical protein